MRHRGEKVTTSSDGFSLSDVAPGHTLRFGRTSYVQESYGERTFGIIPRNR
jgi:hypothetical protein